jgi:HEAT repeat protein
MSFRFVTMLALFAALIFSTMLNAQAVPPPPAEINGKSYEAWKKDIKNQDPSRRIVGMQTMLAFGVDKAYDALPDIIGELKKHKNNPIDMSVRVNGMAVMTTILANKKKPDEKIVDEAFAIYKMFLKDEQVLVKTRAAQGIACLGPAKAQEAITDVIAVARNTSHTYQMRKDGLLALTAIAVDNKVVHAKVPGELRFALDDSASEVRMTALNSMVVLNHFLAKDDKAACIDKITGRLKAKKEDDPAMLIAGHGTIMSLSGDPPAANLAAVAKYLHEKDLLLRTQALGVINLFGPKAQGAIDDIIAVAEKHPSDEFRKSALDTLLKMAYDKNGLHPKVPAALRNALDDKVPEIRLTALQAIGPAKVGLDKAERKLTIGKLNAFLAAEKEPMLQMWAHAAIMTVAEQVTKDHVEPLVTMLGHKEVPVRLQALQLIALCGKDAKPFALNAVVALIKDPELTVGVAAIDALPRLRAFETTDMLKKIVADKDADPALREAAQESLDDFDDIMTLERKKDKSDKKDK